MGIVQGLCELALKQFAGDSMVAVVGFLRERSSPTTTRLLEALRVSNERAWNALEVALGGQSWWQSIKGKLINQDTQVFGKEIRAFLDATPLVEIGSDTSHRQHCLNDLRKARDKGILAGAILPEALAQSARRWSQHTSAASVVSAEVQALEGVVGELEQGGYTWLAWLLKHRPYAGMPLVVVAFRFFFQREVERSQELSRGLGFQQLQGISDTQRAAFRNLDDTLAKQQEKLDVLLDQGEIHRRQLEEVLRVAKELLVKCGSGSGIVPPRPGVTVRSDEEHRLVRQVLDKFRALPAEAQRQAELLSLVGQVQDATGNSADALETFRETAGVANTPVAQAQAHFNAYRSALKCGAFDKALADLQKAIERDAESFAPFPPADYEPLEILGAGGFGVTFLCRLKLLGGKVAVKALMPEEAKRQASDVLGEAAALLQLRHPSIVGFQYCGFADRAHTRPYVVMEYFEGQTLHQYVKEQGLLPQPDFKEVARLLAGALAAAHDKGILHRDVKPANLLIHKKAQGWEIRLIDFGLALTQGLLDPSGSTIKGGLGVTGTIDYAAPEQLGRVIVPKIGPTADVYGFGRTCCYALFGTPHPLAHHWDGLTPSMKNWLTACLAEQPADRHQNFASVLQVLQSARTRPGKVTEPTPPKPPKPPAPSAVPVPAAPPEQAASSAPAPAPRLVVLRGRKPQAVYSLGEGVNLIGRAEECPVDIDLEDQESPDQVLVSRRHATITLTKGVLVLEDLGSTNGTFVNRTRVPSGERRELRTGDIIQIGPLHLKVIL